MFGVFGEEAVIKIYNVRFDICKSWFGEYIYIY